MMVLYLYPKFLESSMVSTGFANVILTLVSIPDSKKAKMFVVIGQKKDWMEKTIDFIVIDFGQQFDLFEKYIMEKYMDFCPSFDYVCGGAETTSKYMEGFNREQEKVMYKFMEVLAYEKLKEVFPK